MKKWCNIRSIDPKDLTEKQFLELNEVTQDMWAHGIWEFVQCKCCNKMMSKQDIFWHLQKELYEETVSKIMSILDIKEIPCIECWNETKFIYWDEHIENIKDRLLNSQQAFLAICENENWQIVWYEEWYIDSMENIFNRELAYHYSEIWLPEIKKRVFNILWETPENMLVLSSIWFIHKYANFYNLYEIIKSFWSSIPDDLINEHGITELDKRNALNKIWESVWNISLWIYDDEILRNKIVNIWNWYQSNLTILPRVWHNYRKYTSDWPKNFIKLIKENIN